MHSACNKAAVTAALNRGKRLEKHGTDGSSGLSVSEERLGKTGFTAVFERIHTSPFC